MKQEDRSVMTSAVRRLGQEISKLGLRMRNRSPSGSDSDVFCSTEGSLDGQSEKTLSQDNFENDGASGSCNVEQPVKQRRYSRNELDEDVECKERRSSIKASLRPVLSRKARSDLAKYTRPNQDLNLKQFALRKSGSTNGFKESVKENNVDGLETDKNGKGEESACEMSSATYRVATGESQVGEHVDKTKKPRRPRRPKRSKSFSGLLNWRHGAKQANKEATGNGGCKPVARKLIRTRSNSFSGTVENIRGNPVTENAIARTLQKQNYMGQDINETNGNNVAKHCPQIFVTANGEECTNGMRKSSGTRLSYMALKGFRYEQGMIETDLCSTEL